MNAALRIVFGLVLFAGAAKAAERDLVRTFPVAGVASVAIDTYRGGITVIESDYPEVRIAVHLEIGSESEAEAEEMLRTLKLEFSQTGEAVTVMARRPAESVRFVWNEKKQIEPTYRVTVPRMCNLTLATRTGTIIVGNVVGNLRARSGTGDIFFRSVEGSIDAAVEEGELVISRCRGSVNARVDHGAIRVGTITGPCELENRSGDVDLMAAKSDVRVHVEAGTATVGLRHDYSGRAEIKASGGAIVLNVDPAAQCRIDAAVSLFSRVDCRLPLTIENGSSGGRSLRGRLNEGTSDVLLRANGGNILLQPAKAGAE